MFNRFNGKEFIMQRNRTCLKVSVVSGLISICILCVVKVYGEDLNHSYKLNPEKFTEQIEGLTLQVDSRIEFLRVVQSISGDKLDVNGNDCDYLRSVRSNFKPDMELASAMNDLLKRGFSYDAPDDFILDNGYDFSHAPRLTARAKPWFGSKSDVHRLNAVLEEYAKSNNFNDFFRANEGYYRSLLSAAKAAAQGGNYVRSLESFYGMRNNSYTVILSPLTIGGYGLKKKNRNGLYDCYTVMTVPSSVEGEPDFRVYERLGSMCYHEFSHSFVNPLLDDNRQELNRYAVLFNQTYDCYQSWTLFLNEQIVRAATIVLMTSETKPWFTEKFLVDNEEKIGFVYTGRFVRLLREYETNRNTYKDMKSFIPRIVSELRVLTEEKRGLANGTNALTNINGVWKSSFNNIHMQVEFSGNDVTMEISIDGEGRGNAGGKYRIIKRQDGTNLLYVHWNELSGLLDEGKAGVSEDYIPVDSAGDRLVMAVADEGIPGKSVLGYTDEQFIKKIVEWNLFFQRK